MLPLPSTSGREVVRGGSWSRKARFLLIPAGVLLFLYILTVMQPSANQGGYSKYIHQQRYASYSPSASEYQIAVISDMDTKSRVSENELKWRGVLKVGTLRREGKKYSIEWTSEKQLNTKYNEEGRGMELSDLVDYNGKLLTCDDRTGIVFEVMMSSGLAIPRHILVAGDGSSTDKGLKCEWLFVKNNDLWAGSIGKEYVRNGKIVSHDNEWVKIVSPTGSITHVDWTENFVKIRKFLGAEYPGYVVHEAIGWSEQLKKYVVLPRRISSEAYDEKVDEERGSNQALIISEDFSSIKKIELGPHDETHGFSSFKFVPWRENEIVALKTKEHRDTTETYITVFDLNTQEVLLEETLISDSIKFEGVEFL